MKSEDLKGFVDGQSPTPWTELLQEAIAEYELETGGVETATDQFVEWLAEWGRDLRRRQRGLLLLTAHRAKGLEFDHVVVLDGGWNRYSHGEDADAPRRLYYVAMSRARQTLTLARFPGAHPFQKALRNSPSVLHRQALVKFPPAPPELVRQYKQSQPARRLSELRGLQTSQPFLAQRHCRAFPWRPTADAARSQAVGTTGS